MPAAPYLDSENPTGVSIPESPWGLGFPSSNSPPRSPLGGKSADARLSACGFTEGLLCTNSTLRGVLLKEGRGAVETTHTLCVEGPGGREG